MLVQVDFFAELRIIWIREIVLDVRATLNAGLQMEQNIFASHEIVLASSS